MKKVFSDFHRGSTRTYSTLILLLGLGISPAIANSYSTEVAKKEWPNQQKISISGVIYDEGTNTRLSGVTILSEGKVIGTSNANGEFSIQVESGKPVIFQSLGYHSKTQQWTSDSQSVRINLTTSDESIEEVIITALGIKREEKSLGYAVSQVTGKQMTDATPSNWVDAMKGKVAGLSITQASSGPLNTARINLRGDRSLDPKNNEALIVVDGIPMVNGRFSSGVTDAYGAGSSGPDKDIPIDFGNGLGDINPDDIESISVLKGAAATALYGSRAGNGALIITTKSGNKNKKGIGISINSNSSFQSILKWPDFQYEYGQGNLDRNADGEQYYSYGLTQDGKNTGSTSSAYGPKFNGQEYFQYDPNTETGGTTRTPWVAYKGGVKDFFNVGETYMNSISLDGGNEVFSSRASLTHTKNSWIMPNTGFQRLVAAINSSAKLSEKLRINMKVNYTNKSSDNLPGTGYNNQSIAYFMIFQNPSISLDWYRPMWKKDRENIEQIHPFSSYIENPFIIAYEMTNSLQSHGIDGMLQGQYTFNPKWEIMLRSGISMRSDQRQQRRPWDTANFPLGYYKQQDLFYMESNTDALLSFNDKINEDFSIRASLGGNLMRRDLKENIGLARGLTSPGVYKLSNASTSPFADNTITQKEIQSIFGMVNLGWREMIFVDLTARNDWSSTLPSNNRSYFYPSVSSSFVLSEMLEMPSSISFAKLRFSWAQVGNDADPYQTIKYFNSSIFPGSAEAPSLLHNANLKPEISNSTEAGLNISFFNNRLTADVNYYFNRSRNQILRVPRDVTTGFSSEIINGGLIQNRGWELSLSGTPVRNENFQWNVSANWAKNNNKILELSEGVETPQQIIASSGSGVAEIIATVGGSTGDLWGYGLVRNDQGQVIYDAKTGLPVRPEDKVKIGNAYADWRGGFHNEFRYKNLSLSALIDGQYGGIVYSQTHHKMTEQGKLEHTLRGRETGKLVGEGVIQNEDGSFSPNTKEVAINTYYADYYRRANVETNSFDASYLKLREVRFEYALPKTWVSRWKMNSASVAFFGRDLFMISNFPMYDPETAALNGATIMPGVEMGQMPSTRTFGMNLKVNF
ncbi:SusC/RagA family TonB-linked outer membrane protein [Sphingobacterium cellulitidis]|uniref:SusC/RagA family TonB-linked outer membrane protein n=1 Tax=Sphingobacterium cellulitidis TaxID=1768011 RepID=UPI000B93C34C|nr:SusC/RagA family protein [Sphingobacterium cellulitidis]